MQWYEYISDSYINGLFSVVVSNYKVVAMLVIGPIIWAIKRYTDWTPWKSDDQIVDLIKKKLGMGEP